jgi:hypothetical protein
LAVAPAHFFRRGRQRNASAFAKLFLSFVEGVYIKGRAKTPTATAQNTDGTLLVTIPPDASEVEVVFTEPPRTMISFIIAALGWMFAVVLLILGFLKVRTVQTRSKL